ncbi:hypothetical protein DY000_02000501 [Brassica cretica]|uniref:NB-ARC domain-containing protein n=1 Tax=Brassica cretica TaxID=69181 RepID=A0ABQ7BUV9_BRACR|nr:hypothetical protein DY000_02000501 [Brassica cretica]
MDALNSSIVRDNEAAMIKKIATDISNMLNNFTPSNDFDGLVGMEVHLEKLEPLLCLGSDEVRMIGIWGSPGIGKTTIARVAYNQLSNSFQLSVFMDDLKSNYSRLCSDDYSAKLQLQQLFLLVALFQGSKSVIGIKFCYREGEEIEISEKAFEGMSNLQFLDVYSSLQLTRGLNYLPHKLRLLEWSHFPLTCFPCNVNFEFLVELNMDHSKLEKLWEGIKPLRSLKWMDLSNSVNLKELPDLSTATNLEKLNLRDCSSLIKLPSLPGNSLEKLHMGGCSSLLDFPSFSGNVVNLRELNLINCSNLVELPLSLGNLQKLQILILNGCSKLEVLPTNINLEHLVELNLCDCSMLKCFPEISTNIRNLNLRGTAIEQVPPSIRSWPHLEGLQMSYFENLKDLPHALERITYLCLVDTDIQEVPPWVKKISRLRGFLLNGCQKLVSFPQLSDSITYVYVSDCESLDQEARDNII